MPQMPTHQPSQPTIAIVGAGIGGLAAALACKASQLKFQLFDHAPHPHTSGFALTLWPNALVALRELGLFDQSGPDWLHPMEHGQLRTAKDEPIYELPLQWMKETYGFRPTCVLRTELLKRMYNALEQPPIQQTHINAVEQNEEKVSIRLANGTHESFDGLIAADGIHSAIRRNLFGIEERTVGYTAWRGIAEGAAVPSDSMCEYVGLGVRFGYAAVSPSLTYWFATMNNHLASHDASGPGWAQVERRLQNFPSAVQSCMNTPPSETMQQNVVQYVPTHTPLAINRIALLGDAGHAITPNLGLGACLALEDAIGLQQTLQSHGVIREAFVRYAEDRQKRVARISRWTKWLGDVTQLENPFLSMARNKSIAFTPNTLTRAVWKSILG